MIARRRRVPRRSALVTRGLGKHKKAQRKLDADFAEKYRCYKYFPLTELVGTMRQRVK